jgi:hypothetical protein
MRCYLLYIEALIYLGFFNAQASLTERMAADVWGEQ